MKTVPFRLLLVILASGALVTLVAFAGAFKRDDSKSLSVETTLPTASATETPIAEPLEHDFGVVTETACRHEFLYKNKESKSLRIRDLRVTCACLKIVDAPKEIAPGETGKFIVDLGMEKVVGFSSQILSVMFEDERPPLGFRVTAFAPGFQLRPNRLQFGRVGPNASVAKDVSVVVGGVPDAAVLDVSTSDPRLKATLHDVVTDTTSLQKAVGQLARLEVQVSNSDSTRLGILDGKVTLHVNGASQHYIDVNVSALFTAAYSVNPETVFLGTLLPGDTVERMAMLTSATDDAQKLTGPIELVSEHAEITATLKEGAVSPDNGQQLVVRCAATPKSKAGPLRGKILGKSGENVLFTVPYVVFLSENK